MSRQLIQPRSYQEPIHESAPGFDSNSGHKNLITELNTEVLPSWITDIVGGPAASSDDYQLRVNASGVLQRYDLTTTAWVDVITEGGGGGGSSYNPSHYATVTVTAAYVSDAIAYFELTTQHAYGRDIRVYQDNLLRRANVSVKNRDLVNGTVTYGIAVEGTWGSSLSATFVVKYGDPLATWEYPPDWTLSDDYDYVIPPTAGNSNAWVIVKFKETPLWWPKPTSEADLPNHFTNIANVAVSTPSRFTVPGSSFYNPNLQIVEPVKVWPAGWTWNDLTTPNTSSYGVTNALPGFNTIRDTTGSTAADWLFYGQYFWELSTAYGTVYAAVVRNESSSTAYGSSLNGRTYIDFFATLNNGWLLYSPVKSTDGTLKERNGGFFAQANSGGYVELGFEPYNMYDGVSQEPPIFAYIPTYRNATVVNQDQVI